MEFAPVFGHSDDFEKRLLVLVRYITRNTDSVSFVSGDPLSAKVDTAAGMQHRQRRAANGPLLTCKLSAQQYLRLRKGLKQLFVVRWTYFSIVCGLSTLGSF